MTITTQPGMETSPVSKSAPADYVYRGRNATVVSETLPQGQQPSQSAVEVARASAANAPSTQTIETGADPVDLSFLDLPLQTADAQAQVAETPVEELSDEESVKFAKQFEKVFGIPPQAAAQQFQQLAEYRAQQGVQEQLGSLKKAWNVTDDEVSQRLKQVTERFNKYPKDLQGRLDNTEGAQLIWAKIQMEQQGQAANVKTPTLDRSTAPNGATGARTVTKQQLAALTPEEWKANEAQILQLYAAGRVVG